jgi:hypothetical protein
MDGKFDVFDQYGQFVGRIIPSGEGYGGSILAFLAIATLWIFGFLIYAYVSSTIEGFKALGRGEIGKAALFLGIPTIACCLVLSLPVAMAISEGVPRIANANLAQKFDLLLESGRLVQITEVSRQDLDMALCNTHESTGCREFAIENISDGLDLWISGGSYDSIVVGPNASYQGVLTIPGQSVTAYCATSLVVQRSCSIDIKLQLVRSSAAQDENRWVHSVFP